MSRRTRSLHFNLKEGENVVYHRDYRSKKSRSKTFRDDTPAFLKKKRHLEEVKAGVDKYSLRLLRKRYKI